MKKVLHKTIAAAILATSMQTHAIDAADMALGAGAAGSFGAAAILGKSQVSENIGALKKLELYNLNTNDLKPLPRLTREDLIKDKRLVQEFKGVYVTSNSDVLEYKYVTRLDDKINYSTLGAEDGRRIFDSIKELGENSKVKITYQTVSYTTSRSYPSTTHYFNTNWRVFEGNMEAAKDALLHNLPRQEVVQVNIEIEADRASAARIITERELNEKNAQIDRLNAERAKLRSELASQNENIMKANLEIEKTGAQSQETLLKIRNQNLRIKALSRAAGVTGVILLGLIVVKNAFGEKKVVACQDAVCAKMIQMQQEALQNQNR